jgi:hypothetical protein
MHHKTLILQHLKEHPLRQPVATKVSMNLTHLPIPDPTPSIDTLVASINPIVSLQGTLPLNPPNMSVNNTTTNAPSGGFKGIAPNIFTGDHSRSDAFWNEFCHYRMLNRQNNAMSIPFYRILTVLSYIKGPIVEDWVNAVDKDLERRTDTTVPGHVAETDEVLWDGFEAAYKSAWKDTA